MFGFRRNGSLPNLGWEEKDERLLGLTLEAVENLEETEADELLESAKRLASGFRPWKRLREVRPDLLEQPEGRKKMLQILLRKYLEFEQDPNHGFGDGALCSKILLQPGQSGEIRFLVTWHFPNHRSSAGNFVGHRYCRWQRDAAEAAGFLMDKSDDILNKVSQFSETLQSGTAPREFAGNWVAQANTLIKCSWWAEDGDFGIWEGLGSCGFHTMDITYHSSFMLLALFPELQLRQMRMGLKFQREDGRVHHFFTPDFGHVDDGFDRVDMNPQFVLMVCRDYLWTGDRAYLEEMNTYGNVQVEANWSGVEFAFASMLLEMGRGEQARELAGNVENRYFRAGRIFNHEECGEHYCRPLSAWTLMLSLSGLKIDCPRREISVNPAEENLAIPWFTPQGYGVMEYGERGLRMRCLEGNLTLRAVKLPWSLETERILAAGENIGFAKTEEKVSFDQEYVIGEGETLEILRS